MQHRRHLPAPAQLSPALADQLVSLATSVPFVMGVRIARAASMGSSPSAADKKEFTRMYSEKMAAAMESSWAMAWSMVRMQQRLWLSSAGLWWAPWSSASFNRAAGRSGQAALQQAFSQGLKPYTRRAAANAKRLQRSGSRK